LLEFIPGQYPKTPQKYGRYWGSLIFTPFIKGFTHIACPLHKLTQKDQEWQWGTEEQEAFDNVTLSLNVSLDLGLELVHVMT